MRFIIIILFIMGMLLLAESGFAQKKDPINSIQNMVEGILEELATALNKNKQLSKEKEEFAQANQALQTELSECKETASSAFKLQENLDACLAKLTQSENKIRASDGKINELKQQFEAIQMERETLKNTLVLKEKYLEDYKSSSSILQENLNKCQTMTAQSEGDIKDLARQLATLQDRNEILEKMKSAWEKEVKGYQERTIQTDTKMQELWEQVDINQREKRKIEEAKVSLEEEIKGYQARLNQADNKIKELEQKNNALVAKEQPLEDYKALLAKAENKVDELTRQREAQKDKLFKSFYEIGRTHTTEKRYKEAVASFEECVTIKPEDANAHYNLGILYQYVYGDRKGAIYHLKKYLELNPKVKDREEVELLLKVLEK